MLSLGVEFGQFLVDLRAWAAHVWPVEPGTRGAALQFGGAFERRKRQRYARQGALVGTGGAFLGLDDFPQMVAAMLGIAEDVRVTALHLVANPADHVLE